MHSIATNQWKKLFYIRSSWLNSGWFKPFPPPEFRLKLWSFRCGSKMHQTTIISINQLGPNICNPQHQQPMMQQSTVVTHNTNNQLCNNYPNQSFSPQQPPASFVPQQPQPMMRQPYQPIRSEQPPTSCG